MSSRLFWNFWEFRHPWKVLVAAVVVLVAVATMAAMVVATMAGTGGEGREGARAPAADIEAVTVEGSRLPAYVELGDDPAIGSLIPSLSGTNFVGEPVEIVNDDGTAKLLLFLAPWDPHSHNVMPEVQAWIDAGNSSDGVVVYSVVTAYSPGRPNYPPGEWLEREHWMVPVIADPTDAAAQAYGLTAFPYWVSVKADGTVAARRTGELSASELSSILSLAD